MKDIKVIGLGLQKTGTTSMAYALDKLGYKTKHFVSDLISANYYGANASPQECTFSDAYVNLEPVERHDAIIDNPVCFDYVYDEIFAKYPDAKYILTTRPINDWVDSVQNHISQDYYKIILADRILKYENYNPFKDILYTCDNMGVLEYLYQAPYSRISRPDLVDMYEKHHNRIYDIFNDMDNFLVMDLQSGDGWEKLCTFLEVPSPRGSFPHRKKTVTLDKNIRETRIYNLAKRLHDRSVQLGIKFLNRIA